MNENWDAYPLHPGADTADGFAPNGPGDVNVVPSASRAGDILRLDGTPFSDSNGHTGEGFFNADSPVTGSYQIDENGKKITGGKAISGPGRAVPLWADFHFWQVKLGPKPALITFTVTPPPGWARRSSPTATAAARTATR